MCPFTAQTSVEWCGMFYLKCPLRVDAEYLSCPTVLQIEDYNVGTNLVCRLLCKLLVVDFTDYFPLKTDHTDRFSEIEYRRGLIIDEG